MDCTDWCVIGSNWSPEAAICFYSATNRGNERHSAYRSKLVIVEYRWHPLFGEKVPLIRRTGRLGSDVVHVEVRRGLSRELPPWMFDSTVCKAMTLGSPQVEVASLNELRAVLDSLSAVGSSGRSLDFSKNVEQSNKTGYESFKKTTGPNSAVRTESRVKRSSTRGVGEDFGGPTVGGARRGNKRKSRRTGRDQ
jgi:hypothetical protein